MLSLLDCSLRDGGHIVDGNFYDVEIDLVAQGLRNSGVRYVEIGLVGDQFSGRNYGTFRDNLQDLIQLWVPGDSSSAIPSIMVRPDWTSTEVIDSVALEGWLIRLAFKPQDLKIVENFASLAMSQGAQVSLNPIDTVGFSARQLNDLLALSRDLDVDVVSIVDTYGRLTPGEVMELARLFSDNLPEDTALGFHLHENLLLAGASLLRIIELKSQSQRNFVVDASLGGIGRDPGNLKLELAAYLVSKLSPHGSHLDLRSLFSVAGRFLESVSKRASWGYSVEYAMSAIAGIDRTYGEKVMETDLDRGVAFQRFLNLDPGQTAYSDTVFTSQVLGK